MLLWEIRGQKDLQHRRGWVVAWSHGEAHGIARQENAEVVGEPVEWLPSQGGQVFWRTDFRETDAIH